MPHVLRACCFLLACYCVAALAGCNDSFEPFEESEVTFSLFGYLDVAADTQFVRVAELRQTAFEDATVNATVTLERVGEGTSIVLRDSLVRLGNGALVHNFWTPEPIAPATTFRIAVSGPEGQGALATFATPPTFPNPELDSGIVPLSTSISNPPEVQQITFSGIERLADVRIRYVLSDGGRTIRVSYLDRVVRHPDGRMSLAFSAYEDVQEALTGTAGQGCPGLLSAQLFVAAATEDWPEFLDLDPEAITLPNTASNVEGGLGYVGGVETRSHVWEAMRGVFFFHQGGCAP